MSDDEAMAEARCENCGCVWIIPARIAVKLEDAPRVCHCGYQSRLFFVGKIYQFEKTAPDPCEGSEGELRRQKGDRITLRDGREIVVGGEQEPTANDAPPKPWWRFWRRD